MAKHANNGRDLEQLVAVIEKLRLPDGFAIATNRRLFDASGKQIAEFDVVIEGHVGTVPLQCLIECRDRPSEGPAPREWMEQLDSRRRHNGFATVMAVSTTGFSAPAIEFAGRVG